MRYAIGISKIRVGHIIQDILSMRKLSCLLIPGNNLIPSAQVWNSEARRHSKVWGCLSAMWKTSKYGSFGRFRRQRAPSPDLLRRSCTMPNYSVGLTPNCRKTGPMTTDRLTHSSSPRQNWPNHSHVLATCDFFLFPKVTCLPEIGV